MTCRCFIKHAITGDERREAADRLSYSRSIGDTNGMIIALTALTGYCPAREQKEKEEDE